MLLSRAVAAVYCSGLLLLSATIQGPLQGRCPSYHVSGIFVDYHAAGAPKILRRPTLPAPAPGPVPSPLPLSRQGGAKQNRQDPPSSNRGQAAETVAQGEHSIKAKLNSKIEKSRGEQQIEPRVSRRTSQTSVAVKNTDTIQVSVTVAKADQRQGDIGKGGEHEVEGCSGGLGLAQQRDQGAPGPRTCAMGNSIGALVWPHEEAAAASSTCAMGNSSTRVYFLVALPCRPAAVARLVGQPPRRRNCERLESVMLARRSTSNISSFQGGHNDGGAAVTPELDHHDFGRHPQSRATPTGFLRRRAWSSGIHPTGAAADCGGSGMGSSVRRRLRASGGDCAMARCQFDLVTFETIRLGLEVFVKIKMN